MIKARTDKERWDALMDAMSEDVANMPDEQLMREFSDSVAEDTQKVHSILGELLDNGTDEPYELVKAALEEHNSHRVPPSLPDSPDARRELLFNVMRGGHPWSEMATLAFRELNDPADLPDEEILSLLEDLAELSEDDEL